MTQVTRFAALLSLVALCVASSAAPAAAKQAPIVTPLGASAPTSSLNVGPTGANATCTLGITDAPAYIVDYVYPPNDQYYTFISPAQCNACQGGPVYAVTAHFWVDFRTTCTQVMSIGIYGASGDPTCYSPNPAQVLCAPFNVTVTPPGPGDYDVSVPVPAGCCISGPAFLKVEFVAAAPGCGTSSNFPRLITTASCTNACTSWNIYPGGGPDDLCADIGFPGYPVMNLDVDCCNATPTFKHTWGGLKSVYR